MGIKNKCEHAMRWKKKLSPFVHPNVVRQQRIVMDIQESPTLRNREDDRESPTIGQIA